MTSKMTYMRKFIILDEKSIAYTKSKSIKGYAKLEVRDKKGTLQLNVEGLNSLDNRDKMYKGYLLSKKSGRLYKAEAGNIIINESGKGTAEWKFNPYDVDGTGLTIEDFNLVIVRLVSVDKEDTDVIVPLAGYIHNKDESVNYLLKELERETQSIKIKEEQEALKGEEIEGVQEVEEAEEIQEIHETKVQEDMEEEVIEDINEQDAEEVEDTFSNNTSEAEYEAQEDLDQWNVEDLDEDVKIEEIINKDIKEYLSREAEEEIVELENFEEESNKEYEEVEEQDYNLEGENAQEDDIDTEAIEEIEDEDIESENLEVEINEEIEEEFLEADAQGEDLDEKEVEDLEEEDQEDEFIEVEDNLDDYFTREYEDEQEQKQEDLEQIKKEDNHNNEFDRLRYNDNQGQEQTYGHKISQGYNYSENVKNYSTQIANYAMNILKFFEKVDPLEDRLEGYTWWEIEYDPKNIYKGFLPFYNYLVNMYYPYPAMARVTTCQGLIKKYRHYLFGTIVENDDIEYYVYGIPGKFAKSEQPMNGATGFTTWLPKKNSNEKLGYWLLYIDPISGKIVKPLNPTIPSR